MFKTFIKMETFFMNVKIVKLMNQIDLNMIWLVS